MRNPYTTQNWQWTIYFWAWNQTLWYLHSPTYIVLDLMMTLIILSTNLTLSTPHILVVSINKNLFFYPCCS